jgi:NADH dehydrogenase FAD-containing subunit
VSAIDVSSKRVILSDNRSIFFDYLVIASGSTTASTSQKNSVSIPFKQSNADNIKSLIGGAQDAIDTAQNIVIGGAGPIGVELAGEIAEAANQSRRTVTITLVSASDRVLPMLKPAGSAVAEKLLARKGVRVLKNHKVKSVTQSSNARPCTVILDNRQLEADLYIPTTGVLPNNEFIPIDFLDQNGWVIVDKELRVTGRQEGRMPPLPIFAAGDITNNSMRLSFKAQEQASVVASNLKAGILGQGKRRSYDQGDGIMMMVPVGATGGTGLIFDWTPWSSMVKMVKGRDFLISRARSAITSK